MAHDAPHLIEHVGETVPSYGSVEPSERAKEQRESRALLVSARVICSAASFSEGFIDGFVSIADLFIKSALNLTDFEYDSIDGIYFFFLCGGGLFTGYLADSRGRLFAMSVSLLCYIFGMLVVSVAQVYLVFFVGLALAGVGVGVGLAANTMYFTEIVPKDIRGQFVALEEVSILLGLACGYASGWFFYCLQYEWSWSEGWNFACWRAVGFCGIIAPLVVLILLNTGFVLESPRYLLMVGREDEGKELLIRLVGREEASVALADWSNEEESSATWWQVIWDRTPSERRALQGALSILSIQSLVGNPVLMVYLASVLIDTLDSIQLTLIVCFCVTLVRMVAASLAAGVVDSFGRRLVFCTSLCLLFLGWTLLTVAYAAGFDAYVKVALFVVTSVAYDCGVGPIAFPYSGEILSTPFRSKGLSCGMAAKGLSAWILAEGFSYVVDDFGLSVGCAMIAVMSLFALIWSYGTLPETAGVQLEQISLLFDDAKIS